MAAAVAARDAFDLAQVLVLPSRVPPHRPSSRSPRRFTGSRWRALAVAGVDRLLASDDELRLEGPSYTADTLDRQHARGLRGVADFLHHRRRRVRGNCDLEALSRGPRSRELRRGRRGPGTRIDALRVTAAGARGSHAPGPRPARAAGTARTPLIYLLQAPTPDVSSTIVRRPAARAANRFPAWCRRSSNNTSSSTRLYQISCMAKTERKRPTTAKKKLTGDIAKAVQAALDKKAHGRRGAGPAAHAGVHRFLPALFGPEHAAGARDRGRGRGSAARGQGASRATSRATTAASGC